MEGREGGREGRRESLREANFAVMKIPDGRVDADGGEKKNFARERASELGGGRLHCMPPHGNGADGRGRRVKRASGVERRTK